MKYTDALNYIHSTPKFQRVLGNDLLKKLLSVLNNPEKKLKFIHIAGTNGKGSTAVMTASVLQKAGYKTGLFTSPFIERFNERIQINNIPIPDDTLAQLTETVMHTIDKYNTPVSEFALITAIAFLYFASEQCDIVILETGLGGRLDATNVIENPLLCVITSISLDHTRYLGDTIELIASEKFGIIKENVPVILYPIQKNSVFDIARHFCTNHHSQLLIPDIPSGTNDNMIYKNEAYTLSLKGSYQINNAAVVIEIINFLKLLNFKISPSDLKYGLSHTKWIARFEFLSPSLIIDGSHNPDGVKNLKADLLALNKSVTLIIAMMDDKEYSECVRLFSEITSNVIITQIDIPRCCRAEALAAEFEKHGIAPVICKTLTDAIALAEAEKNITCICGSLYLAGEARRLLSSTNPSNIL